MREGGRVLLSASGQKLNSHAILEPTHGKRLPCQTALSTPGMDSSALLTTSRAKSCVKTLSRGIVASPTEARGQSTYVLELQIPIYEPFRVHVCNSQRDLDERQEAFLVSPEACVMELQSGRVETSNATFVHRMIYTRPQGTDFHCY
eukprot:5204484-Pleurochrysis_carterae.AAC.3